MEWADPIAKSQTVLIGSTLAILTVLGTYFYQRRKNKPPSNWESVGKVTELCLYPLKSGKRKPLRAAECTKYGIKQRKEDERVYQMRDRY